MRLLQVDVGYACFGVVVEGGKVVDAAPIGRWMIGKDEGVVRAWVAQKGGRIA